MTRVVLVHGVGQQYVGESMLASVDVPALLDGMARAGYSDIAARDVACAFYGDLFRPVERMLGDYSPAFDEGDLDEGFETDILVRWWHEAARTDPEVPPPDERTLARTPKTVQAALNALSGSAFFRGLTDRALIGDLKQMNRYFREPALRQAAVARVHREIDENTRVLVGHSMGSVVAYEALCANPGWPLQAFVTLGSPLGIRNLIYDKLLPTPGLWPGPVRSWVNIVDAGDVVALVKDLRPLFGPAVSNVLVHNGARAHDMTRYLTSAAVGRAIADGLGETVAPG
ncbi:hypothetical protein [Amycolatopsis sp. lyj-109]|uniref:hypothetical protein n=1 Tax=Amycolatopsis sp. lyj-109 TaxID=2789287 RepID=UPI003978D819